MINEERLSYSLTNDTHKKSVLNRKKTSRSKCGNCSVYVVVVVVGCSCRFSILITTIDKKSFNCFFDISVFFLRSKLSHKLTKNEDDEEKEESIKNRGNFVLLKMRLMQKEKKSIFHYSL